MAVLRSKRLAIVLHLAKSNEDKAADLLRQFREQLTLDQNQLLELQEYCDEYAALIKSQRAQQNVQTVITYRHFWAELNRSVELQQHKVSSTELQCQRIQQQWQQLYQRRKNIAELIERLRLSESAAEELRLQKELDELVSRVQSSRFI